MARFNYSGTHGTAGTGRLNTGFGGSVLLKNGVVRAYKTPVNPQTESQTINRNLFRFLTQAFKGLTPENIAAWEAARTSGDWRKQDPFTGTSRNFSSAKSLFIFVNTNLAIANNTVAAPSVTAADPIGVTALPALGITSIIPDGSSALMPVVYSGTLGTSILYFRMTAPVSPGNQRLTSVKSKLRSIKIQTGATPIALAGDYGNIYPGAIDTPNVGQVIGYTVEQIDTVTGLRGFVASGFATIVA